MKVGRKIGAFLRRAALIGVLTLSAAALSGCLYPQNQLKQNQTAPREAVRNVQAAVDDYMKETGLLPIKNAQVDTPVYEKFVLDFKKLQDQGFIGDIPSAAFEGGGRSYFIVIDEETDPRVKLMDLVTVQGVNDLTADLQAYASRNGGELPRGGKAYPGFHYVDFDKLNKKADVIRSVYSGQTLSYLIGPDDKVYVDYGPDITQAIGRSGKTDYDAGMDLRTLLVDGSVYVPVKSPAYFYVNGEPRASLP